MLKFFQILRRIGAHLVETKDVWKETRIVHFRGLSALNMQKYF
jgi:hypothetical protein